jgi:hypothetical protein
MPEGPPSVVPIPHTDITRMQLWRSGDWLFLRVDFAGDIPATASPVVQGENLVTSGVSVTMDSDHSYDTGAHNLNLVDQVALGVDLVFAIQVSYATNASPMGGAYVLYDIGAITDRFGGTAQGELRGGGPGTSYLCARWPLSAIPPKYWVVGTPALLMGSAETESTHYHHYAYDATLTKTWSLP